MVSSSQKRGDKYDAYHQTTGGAATGDHRYGDEGFLRERLRKDIDLRHRTRNARCAGTLLPLFFIERIALGYRIGPIRYAAGSATLRQHAAGYELV